MPSFACEPFNLFALPTDGKLASKPSAFRDGQKTQVKRERESKEKMFVFSFFFLAVIFCCKNICRSTPHIRLGGTKTQAIRWLCPSNGIGHSSQSALRKRDKSYDEEGLTSLCLVSIRRWLSFK